MSFPKKGKVFPPNSSEQSHPEPDYATIVSEALRIELGHTRRAVKTLMEWTGANERTVKNWHVGTTGPNGDHLIVLLAKSDAVLRTLLAVAGRLELLEAMRAVSAPNTLTKNDPSDAVRATSSVPDDGRKERDQMDGVVSSTRDDTINVPGNGTINVPINSSSLSAPNERQDWFVANLAQGICLKAADMQLRWGVSNRTAKRDIADLKERGLIDFVGARKNGDYRLTRR